jgi:Bacteriophage Lambda NinG protein
MKLWKASTADTKFSEIIRKRDGKCVRCGKKEGRLQNSHYWSRVHWATRFNLDNCDTLCWACHYGNEKGWEYDIQGEYQDYMIKKLGQQGYDRLKILHNQPIKKRVAIQNFQENYEYIKESMSELRGKI